MARSFITGVHPVGNDAGCRDIGRLRRNPVFFSSSSVGQVAGSENSEKSSDRTTSRQRRGRSGLRAAALAVALVAPAAGIWVAIDVTPAVAQQAGNPADQLQSGLKQYRDEQYEEAVKTLKGINADSLSASGQSMLKDTLGK